MMMERTEILEKIGAVIRDIFGDDSLVVTEETGSENLEDWDSVLHIQLIFEIEDVLGIQFYAEDIPELTSVGVIADKTETLLESSLN